MKPYAVAVTIGEKTTGKEFDTLQELKAFIQKAEELKKKAPTLLVKILRMGVKKEVTKPLSPILDLSKEECQSWSPLVRAGVPVVDTQNKQLYKSVPVAQKKGVLYCPYCHGYKEFGKVDLGYGGSEKGCTDCGVTINDFHIKTVNGLWKGKI